MKARVTLERLFEQPPPTDLPWADVLNMLRTFGVDVRQQGDVRIALCREEHVMIVSRPLPEPLAVRATVQDLAAFLKTVGMKP